MSNKVDPDKERDDLICGDPIPVVDELLRLRKQLANQPGYAYRITFVDKQGNPTVVKQGEERYGIEEWHRLTFGD